jgi:hypothetical protein
MVGMDKISSSVKKSKYHHHKTKLPKSHMKKLGGQLHHGKIKNCN